VKRLLSISILLFVKCVGTMAERKQEKEQKGSRDSDSDSEEDKMEHSEPRASSVLFFAAAVPSWTTAIKCCF